MAARCCGLTLVLLTVLMSPALALCPYNIEACTCRTNLISCRNLNSLPPLVSGNEDGNFSVLVIRSGKLNSIPENSLPSNLSDVLLADVPITYISPEAFDTSSNTLEYLSLDNITYPELPKALLQVRNLTDLSVVNTLISTWDAAVLQHVANTAYTVTFANVGLTRWPEWLRGFTLVTSMDVSKNALPSIPSDAFSSMLNLNTLNLFGNQLSDSANLLDALSPVANRLTNLDIAFNNFTSIPTGLAKIINLSTLPISRNKIEGITADRIPVQLRDLDIGYNQIKQLTDTSFPSSSSLRTLTLDGNPLTIISKLAFQPLNNLRELSLRSTHLMTLPLALTTLKDLNVLNLKFISELRCDCPRDNQLVQWYQSQKNMTISGNCYQRYFDLNLYFRNDTLQDDLLRIMQRVLNTVHETQDTSMTPISVSQNSYVSYISALSTLARIKKLARPATTTTYM